MTRGASEILATSGRFIDAATFGAFLKNHRASRNLSLHDVAAETKIATLTWATTSSDAAGAMDTNRIAPVSTAGDQGERI